MSAWSSLQRRNLKEPPSHAAANRSNVNNRDATDFQSMIDTLETFTANILA